MNYVDFKSAFDCISRDFIWRSMAYYGLPVKYIRIIKCFFTNTTSAVRHIGELTDWFAVNSGTGQGDIQGPPIFNFCLNLVAHLTETNKVVSQGAALQLESPRHAGVSLMDMDYADDMALVDNTKEGLQETTDLLCKYAAYAGLQINAKKTKSMATGKNTSQRPYTKECTLDIAVGDIPIEQVSNFVYLGATISSDGTIDRELSARIQKASGAYNQLHCIWNNRNIRTPTKVRIYKSAVLTILLYGCEVWNTTDAQMKRFSAFHLKCLRRILRIKWFHRVRNEEVLNRARIKPVEAFIAASRLRWFGHVSRMTEERLPRYLLGWKPQHGRRSRGRPRKTWLNCILEDASDFTGVNNITLEEAEHLASDRPTWRRMLHRRREWTDGAGHSND